MKAMKRLSAAILAASLLVAGCGGAKTTDSGNNAPATGNQPAAEQKLTKLTIGFVPSQDAAQIGDKVKPMTEYLTKELGIPVETYVGTNFVAVVEGMGSKQVDVGFLNPLSYVMAKSDYDVQLLLRTARRGATQYRAQLTVRAEDKIPVCDMSKDKACKATFDALKGKKLAFVEPASTSGYLYPAAYMKNNGISYNKGEFFSDVINAGSHDNAIKAVYDKTVDASWTFEDARDNLVKSGLADAKEKLVPVAYTEWIPNDTISIRKGLPQETVDKLKAAFIKYVGTEEGKKVLTSLYSIDGFAEGKDTDYDVIRSTAKAMNIDIKGELSKSK